MFNIQINVFCKHWHQTIETTTCP